MEIPHGPMNLTSSQSTLSKNPSQTGVNRPVLTPSSPETEEQHRSATGGSPKSPSDNNSDVSSDTDDLNYYKEKYDRSQKLLAKLSVEIKAVLQSKDQEIQQMSQSLQDKSKQINNYKDQIKELESTLSGLQPQNTTVFEKLNPTQVATSSKNEFVTSRADPSWAIPSPVSNITMPSIESTSSTSPLSDTHNLKAGLHQTIQECSRLLSHLDVPKSVDISCESCGKLSEENTMLKIQVENLNSKLTEVVKVNQKWQNYNQRQEEFIEKLKEDVATANTNPGSSITAEQQKEFDRLLCMAKQKSQSLESEKMHVESENQKLRLQCHRLSANINELRARSGGGAKSSSVAPDSEHTKLLETQIQICTEDFESERRDKEKAIERVKELETENELLHMQVGQFQENHMQKLHDRRVQALTGYRNANQSSFYPRGTLQCDGLDVEPGDDMDVIDGHLGNNPDVINAKIDTKTTTDKSVFKSHQTNNSPQKEVLIDFAPSPENNSTLTNKEKILFTPSKNLVVTSDIDSVSPNKSIKSVSANLETNTSMGDNSVVTVSASDSLSAKEPDRALLLYCPKCQKGFQPSQHKVLLKHIEDCCN